MRNRWLIMFALCPLAMGCQLADNAAHNLTYEAKLTTAETLERCNYEKLARAAWETMERTGACGAFSKDYADGFTDGFVDYLQFGGSGQPPYVPPKRYWSPHFRTPEGHQAIEQWYAGFRRGVAAAHQSGYREWVTLPSAHTTETPPGHPVVSIDPTGPGIAVPVESHRPAAPQLPPIPQLMPSGEPRTPAAPRAQTFTPAAPRAQTSTLAPSVLGSPVPPFGVPAIIQPPAKPGISAADVQAEQPSASPRPVWVIEVVNQTGNTAPGKDSTRSATPAPDAETAPVLDAPTVRPVFGPPRTVIGWISTD